MHYHNMLFEIALCRACIPTLITIVLDTLVFRLDVRVQCCFVSSFEVTSVAVVGKGSLMNNLFMFPHVSYTSRLEGALLTGVLDALMLALYVISQTRLGCKCLPTVLAGWQAFPLVVFYLNMLP